MDRPASPNTAENGKVAQLAVTLYRGRHLWSTVRVTEPVAPHLVDVHGLREAPTKVRRADWENQGR